MPRYFLHLRAGDRLTRDDEGSDLPDLAAARAEAIDGAREILAERLRGGEALNGGQIEIADAEGRVLEVVPFTDALLPDRKD